MKAFTQIFDEETFLTFADDEDFAREAFVDHGLPEDGRVREQPLRELSKYRYTFHGETVGATVVGEVPAELRDGDDNPKPSDTLADRTLLETQNG